MKIIRQNILFFLLPLLAPLSGAAEGAPQAERSPSTSETGTNGASSTAGTRRDGTRSTAEATDSAATWRASQIMGIKVENAADETVGEVEDVVLDMETGKILAVIISSGGFLGIADTLSAVPVTTLRYHGPGRAFTTTLTKVQLGRAPQFKNDAWPDYSETGTVAALRSFRDSIGGDVSAPDNTAQNEGENRRDALTPMDQGNSPEDVNITRAIRSSIMDTDLSFNAKNIKIITRDERVTLNGVVESAAEHQAIIMIARIHADTDRITDELEVKSK